MTFVLSIAWEVRLYLSMT